MKLNRFSGASQYYQRVKDYLLQHEASHNLMLGICNTLIRDPERFTHQPYLAAVEENDTILAVALRTPPHKLLVSRSAHPQALQVLVENLYSQSEQPPGVMGPEPSAKTFASAWQAVTGQSYQKGKRQRIYQLETVQPISKALGQFRPATIAERSILIGWCQALLEAIGDRVKRDAERLVDGLLSDNVLYLWQDNVPVSMVGCSGKTPNGISINMVFTPKEYRKKGYATSCVASLSQTLLDSGYKYCFLFTDLDNPTSNHIYQTIGYQPVCDMNDYWFEDR